MSLSTDLKILIVEDAAVMRKMEIKALNSLGFTAILQADDGTAAVEMLQSKEPVDLVISDWNMPSMSGLELLQWIRRQENLRELPFIMATGRGEKKEMAKAQEAGASSFISKPFQPNELQAKMEEALGLRAKAEGSVYAGPSFSSSGKVIIRTAHIQITDHLVLGVLKHMIDTGKWVPQHFELQVDCMESWNPVSKALEQGKVEAAFILAPIAMDLYGHDVPIKLTLFAHKNGSIFVRNLSGGEYAEPYERFFRDKAFFIPHFQSIHHMLAHMFFEGIGLNAGMPGEDHLDIRFEVIPPVKMPESLSGNDDASGYLVAEPLGTKAIASGIADLQFFSSELWQNHPCCVLTMQEAFISDHREAVQEFVQMLVQAGKFIEKKPGTAAEIAVTFLDPEGTLGLRVPLLKNVLTEPLGITTGDLYPAKDDLERIQQYMHEKMDIGKIIDLNEFVDTRFADAACTDRVSGARKSVFYDPQKRSREILNTHAEKGDDRLLMSKLDIEGKYLTLMLKDQDFGIDIMKIREIIKMVPVRPIPHAPAFVLGIFNYRNRVIPVIDLRLVLGMDSVPVDSSNRMIVLEVQTDRGSMQMGVVVDAVSHVTDIKAADVEDVPEFGVEIRSDYLLGMAKRESGIMILLDIDKVLSRREQHTVEKIYSEQAS